MRIVKDLLIDLISCIGFARVVFDKDWTKVITLWTCDLFMVLESKFTHFQGSELFIWLAVRINLTHITINKFDLVRKWLLDICNKRVHWPNFRLFSVHLDWRNSLSIESLIIFKLLLLERIFFALLALFRIDKSLRIETFAFIIFWLNIRNARSQDMALFIFWWVFTVILLLFQLRILKENICRIACAEAILVCLRLWQVRLRGSLEQIYLHDQIWFAWNRVLFQIIVCKLILIFWGLFEWIITA